MNPALHRGSIPAGVKMSFFLRMTDLVVFFEYCLYLPEDCLPVRFLKITHFRIVTVIWNVVNLKDNDFCSGGHSHIKVTGCAYRHIKSRSSVFFFGKRGSLGVRLHKTWKMLTHFFEIFGAICKFDDFARTFSSGKKGSHWLLGVKL